MNSFDKISELDSEIHAVFEEATPIVLELIDTINFPKTAKTFLAFIIKTNFIKEGILELYKTQNYYSINVLFRSLIEHFLRFEYVFFRFGLEKNDTVGEDYLRFCSLSENIDTGKAWKDVAKILDKDPNLDPYEILKEVNEDYKTFSKKYIVDKSSQFRYKNIIRFINSHLNQEKNYKRNSFLLNIIPEYSNLSSFVHGGPGADKALLELDSDEKREKELLRIVGLTFSIAASVKLFSFLSYYQYDHRFGKAYSDIDRIMKKNIR